MEEKKNKPTLHQFHPGIYPRYLWIADKSSKSVINSNFSGRIGEALDLSDEEGNEYACRLFRVTHNDTSKYGFLLHVKKALTTQYISHEAVHIALEYFRDIGAYVDIDNQEPFAYLVGWIADCIYQVKTGKFKVTWEITKE